ncbi:MAG: 2OG-Fe(II) oxygenase [Arcicella sp.]|jgi:hypothetical protein|nr:2OG-Fe(II) oxygenase [Arcicella sp.]
MLEKINWQNATEELAHKGFVVLKEVLNPTECEQLIALYDEPIYRSIINMARYQFGIGEYKYFSYPLPSVVQYLRTEIYPHLAKVANQWMNVLNISTLFPEKHEELLKICHQNEQMRPTPLILKYTEGGYNTLHQDLYGEVWFPFQMVIFLNQPQRDYTGGEFVLIEQRPRMQSVPEVLTPQQGDVLIFTTNFRPVKGTKGYYRTNMRHGVSKVRSGIRHTLGIIFHDAK